MIQTIINLLTLLALAGGAFFMLIGAVGVVRFPDIYHRLHAASKCVTLGISGLLLAAALQFSFVNLSGDDGHKHKTPPEQTPMNVALAEADLNKSQEKGEAVVSAKQGDSFALVVGLISKSLLVIVFQVVASPIAAHMLSRAAHLDRAELWSGTLSDEMMEDRLAQQAKEDAARAQRSIEKGGEA